MVDFVGGSITSDFISYITRPFTNPMGIIMVVAGIIYIIWRLKTSKNRGNNNNNNNEGAYELK